MSLAIATASSGALSPKVMMKLAIALAKSIASWGRIAPSCWRPSVRTRNAAEPVVAQIPRTAAKAARPIEIGSSARPKASRTAVSRIRPGATISATQAAARRTMNPPARATRPIATCIQLRPLSRSIAAANIIMLTEPMANPIAPSLKVSAAAIAITRIARPAARAIMPWASLAMSMLPRMYTAPTRTIIAAAMATIEAAPRPLLPRPATFVATDRTVISTVTARVPWTRRPVSIDPSK